MANGNASFSWRGLSRNKRSSSKGLYSCQICKLRGSSCSLCECQGKLLVQSGGPQVLQHERLWNCLCHLFPDLCDAAARSTAFASGSWRPGSEECRTRAAGFWADCLPMIEARHPEVAAQIVTQLEGEPSGHSVWHAGVCYLGQFKLRPTLVATYCYLGQCT